MSEKFVNNNDKQVFFNQIRGKLLEINNPGEKFTDITLTVGHENVRTVNFVLRKEVFEKMVVNQQIQISDSVVVRFYANSVKKNNRYYTTLSVLDINKT